MKVFSIEKKRNNDDLLVITNQYVKYKDLNIRTSDQIMTNQCVKYENFVIKTFQGKSGNHSYI
jgi:hypothetical protein